MYDGLNLVQEKQNTTVKANAVTGLGLDEVFTRIKGSATRHLLADALGSTLALTDPAGAVQTSYTYAPFGTTTSTGQSNANPFKFTGREDDGTGLYYYRARYYHPGLHRFIREDPLRFLGGDSNFYAYVGTSPLKAADPLGLLVTSLSPNESSLVKPENGPIGVLPPCSQWHGTPDAVMAGSDGTPQLPFRYGPWHKFSGKNWTPPNDVVILGGGTVICVLGTCSMPGGHQVIPGAPGEDWVPYPPYSPIPTRLPDVTPLPPPLCGPAPSKSAG